MAVGPLRQLVAAGHDIRLCVTRPDRRRGRGGSVTPSPVKEAALAWASRVPLHRTTWPTSGVELAVVVAYGRIIPSDVLGAGPHGQSPFLPPAALARCGAGGAGDPGRRPRDRRLRDEGGGGTRHRDRSTPAGPYRSTTPSIWPRCGASWSRWAVRSWSRPWPEECRRSPGSRAPGRGADHGRQADQRGPAPALGGQRASNSTVWCGWVGPGPPSGAGGWASSTPVPDVDACRHRARRRGRWSGRRSSPGHGTLSLLVGPTREPNAHVGRGLATGRAPDGK